MDLRTQLFIQRPRTLFPFVLFSVSLASLSAEPSFIPIVALVALIRTYVGMLITRSPAFAFDQGVLAAALTLGTTIPHGVAAVGALTSPMSSMFGLGFISFITSGVALLAIMAHVWLVRRLKLNSLARIALFPAIWSSMWYLAASANPLGRLTTWTPLSGVQGYGWMRSILGPWGIDWVVGGYAECLAEAIGIWFMGDEEPTESRNEPAADEHNEPLLINGDRHSQTHLDGEASSPATVAVPSIKAGTAHLTFNALLFLLAIPSYFITDIPRPVYPISGSTPLTVACALPTRSSQSSPTTSPLDLFITESQKLTAANIIVWPESAVRFSTAKEREDAIGRVRADVRGPYVVMSFIDDAPLDWEGRSKQETKGKKRNGLLIVHSTEGVVMEYYKQNLVPIAESKDILPSLVPPSLFSLSLRAPRGVTKPDWSPQPPHLRHIPITAGICLDFTSPSLFYSLSSRPSLIIAPVWTWNPSVSHLVWAQARERAQETGADVVFCDGGSGGLSGIVSGRQGSEEGPSQSGEGSWIKTIGMEWESGFENGEKERQKTTYMSWGRFVAPILVWSIVGVAAASSGANSLPALDSDEDGTIRARLEQAVEGIKQRVGGNSREPAARPEAETILINV